MIQPLNIFEDHEQVLGEEICYCLIVYEQFKDEDEESKGTNIEDTTNVDDGSMCGFPEDEDPYKGELAGGTLLHFHQEYYMFTGT